jgi:NADH dehydrogenase [ubiquinone] 1 alpha subcomplex assembly factor 7
MTALKDHLVKIIKLNGPISISDYMMESMTNPQHGYYVNQDPLGERGDFITSPEISQMFGEMIGLWFADMWVKMNCPHKVNLVEFGPGRGTLMMDALRALRVIPDFLKAIDIHLVEASPELQKIQQKKIIHPNINWHASVQKAIEDNDAPIFIIANEFFDALPIKQYQKSGSGWHERMVSLNEAGNELITMLSPFPVQNLILPKELNLVEDHSIVEVSPMSDYIMSEISIQIKEKSGAALIIDYGYTRHQTGETLQAVKSHQYSNIYDNPGDTDLSAHVNFNRLQNIAKQVGTSTYGPIDQGDFLTALGIKQRALQLSTSTYAEQSSDITTSLNRLISPNEMGSLFKVFGISSQKNIVPAGF